MARTASLCCYAVALMSFFVALVLFSASPAESFNFAGFRKNSVMKDGLFSCRSLGSREKARTSAAKDSNKIFERRVNANPLRDAVSSVERGGVSFPFNQKNNTEVTDSTDDVPKKQKERILEEYEFSPHRSKQIQGIANIMLFLGYQGIFFGWVKLCLGFFFIFTKRSPIRFYVSDGFEILSQLAEMYIAKLLRDGGLAFQRVVEQEGSDIDNLFKGLDSFKKIMNQNKTPTFVKWVAVISSILSLVGVFPKHFPGFDTFYHHI